MDQKFLETLIALSRVHTDGMTPFLRGLGYERANVVAAARGERATPAGLVQAISDALHFSATGFTDVRLESWLVREMQDIKDLGSLGFQFRVLARIRSDREVENRSHQYKFALLGVTFGTSMRYAMVRMTQDKLEELLTHLGGMEQAAEHRFVYATQLNNLMHLHIVVKQANTTVSGAELSCSVPGLDVQALLKMLDENLTSSTGTPSPLQNHAKARLQRQKSIVEMLNDTFELKLSAQKARSETSKPQSAITLNGKQCPLTIEVIFPDDTVEVITKPESEDGVIIVVQEHRSGLVEVIFNGSHRDLYGKLSGTEKAVGRARLSDRGLPEVPLGKRTSASEIRAAGQMHRDPHSVRLAQNKA